MEATISIHPDELTESFFQRLKALAKHAGAVEIRLTPSEEIQDGDARINGLTVEEVLRRKKAFDDDEGVIRFTMPEFEEYVKQQVAGV